MAIKRPGAIAPHPLRPKRSGGRRAATCLSREECRAAAGERSCRPPLRVAIEVQPTLGQISPSEAAWHARPDRPGKLIATRRAATQEDAPGRRKKTCLQVSSAPKGWRRRLHAPISCHGIAQREFETGLESELQQGGHSSIKLDNRTSRDQERTHLVEGRRRGCRLSDPAQWRLRAQVSDASPSAGRIVFA